MDYIAAYWINDLLYAHIDHHNGSIEVVTVGIDHPDYAIISQMAQGA